MRVVSTKEIQKLREEITPDSKPQIINPKADYAYVWVQNNHQLMTSYRNLGFVPATETDVKVEGLKPNVERHWESGVDILMMIPKAKREKILEKGKKIAELQMSGLKNDFHNKASRLEIQSVEVEKGEDGEIKIIKD